MAVQAQPFPAPRGAPVARREPDAADLSIPALVQRRALITAEALARARGVTAETGEPFQTVLNRLGLVSEQALAAAIATETGLALLASDAMPTSAVPGATPSTAFLREARVLPIAIEGDRLRLAMADPFDDYAAQAIGFVYGRQITRVVALPSDIDAAIDRLYRNPEGDPTAGASPADEDDLERLRDLVSDAPVIRAVNRLIAEAVDLRASDIHVEPADDRVVVRFRIDGVLVLQPALPPSMRSALVSRIKVMAGLNIAERRLPQDGRMRIAVRGNEIDLRVATAPSIHGETVVLRILDRANLALDFASLGFSNDLTGRLRSALARPYGIVLVTGPTGSGKTTTLYAALAELNSGTRKILTIEDPIEYRLAGIVQMQVNAAIDLSFATALRSFLRQDPDVMMVGEIRDRDTAQIAVQAALTGHTILSTLHTNTAIGAVARLIDMQVEPFLLSSTLNAVLAQRLVRRLCPSCHVPYQPSKAQLGALGLDAADIGPFYRAGGCDGCHQTGFSKRIALIELLTIDDEVAARVLDRADARAIAKSARKNGALSTLLDDGVAKLLAGTTTFEEVLRVAAGG